MPARADFSFVSLLILGDSGSGSGTISIGSAPSRPEEERGGSSERRLRETLSSWSFGASQTADGRERSLLLERLRVTRDGKLVKSCGGQVSNRFS